MQLTCALLVSVVLLGFTHTCHGIAAASVDQTSVPHVVPTVCDRFAAELFGSVSSCNQQSLLRGVASVALRGTTAKKQSSVAVRGLFNSSIDSVMAAFNGSAVNPITSSGHNTDIVNNATAFSAYLDAVVAAMSSVSNCTALVPQSTAASLATLIANSLTLTVANSCFVSSAVYDALRWFGLPADEAGTFVESFLSVWDQTAAIAFANDMNALNYALTLEHLEAAFYQQAQANYSLQDFQAANLTTSDYDRFTLIAAHETAHVAALESTIKGRGGMPVPACTYDFSTVTSVKSYIAVAKLLENTGVSAYDGAINTISDPGLQQVAATIATVEARHAAYLNQLAQSVPFPDVVDNAVAPTGILAAAKPFFVSCPAEASTPVPVVLATSHQSPKIVDCAARPVAESSYTANTTELLLSTYNPDANDLLALNYALTLEHLEAAFYDMAQANFSADDFATAGFDASVYENFKLISMHETAHVAALEAAITARGGSPVPVCAYDFSSVTSVAAYISTAKLLENTGVSAYDGAINTISEAGLQQVAATIATVEARHAAFLNQLDGVVPFPNVTDPTLTPADVVSAVTSSFITSCPFEIKLPILLPSSIQQSPAGACMSELAVAGQASQTLAQQNDLVALNYALTLEHLESAFYHMSQSRYSLSDFQSAGFDATAYNNFVLIAAHEAAHVSALEQIITARGGVPVPPCVYNFSAVGSVADYVSVAGVLENTGVSAYDGAVATISDLGLQQIAATVATVEARHASYLNGLNRRTPFPDTFDTAKAPADILAAASSFIASCPYSIATPVVLPTSKPQPVLLRGCPAVASALVNGTAGVTLTPEQRANDVLALNYALTLEHLESAFYSMSQAQYRLADFQAAGFDQNVFDNFNLIASHESAHVTALEATIRSFDGVPVDACTYNFTAVTSVATYVSVAKLLENTGVSAYDGAINTLTDTGLQTVAATIATVEARHAAYLNQLDNVVPFPDVLDTAVAPKDILARASGFIVSCPQQAQLPRQRDVVL